MLKTEKFKTFLSLILIHLSFFKNRHGIYYRATKFFSNSFKDEEYNQSYNIQKFILKKLLNLYFKFTLIRCDNLLRKNLITLINNPRIDFKLINLIKKLITEEEKKFIIFNISTLIFYRLFLFRGYYSLANIFRAKYQKGIVDNNQKSIFLFFESQLIKIENGQELEKYNKNFNIYESRKFAEINFLSEITSNITISNKNHIENPLINSEYKKFIFNKNIAIVGPTNSKVCNGQEIDSFDIVIRLNHSFEYKGCDNRIKGLKTDISYFNGEQFSHFLLDSDGILPSYLKWVCIKNPKFLFDLERKNKNIKCRNFKMFDRLGMIGELNLIPLLLLDILCYQPKRIKIFHADLYLSIDKYKGYLPNGIYSNQPSYHDHLKSTFAGHDPILQYNILLNLFKNRKIEGDEVFENIMKKGLNSYLINLENIFNF